MGIYFHTCILVLFSLFINECTPLPIESFLTTPKYTRYNETVELFYKLESSYPDKAKVYSIGKSVEGRQLLVLRISENVKIAHPDRPAFKYVANIHGDESIGRQLVVYLAQYLLLNYGKDDRVTKLVNTIDIHLMPSLNPDGYEHSKEGECETLKDDVGRNNAKGVDLNRDFPDQFDEHRSNDDKYLYGHRQLETVALMKWVQSKQFVLSGSLHGGAEVASYPYDNHPGKEESGVESKTPDDLLFKHLATAYASRHASMRAGDASRERDFPGGLGGIINGAKWYRVKGGMQDYNYLHSNSFEVTFELSVCKYPIASELPTFWHTNKDALLAYIEQSHIGVTGIVKDESGEPVKNAQITVEGINHPVMTTEDGYFWRLLLPGQYNITAVASGYSTPPPILTTVPVNQMSPVTVKFTVHRAGRGRCSGKSPAHLRHDNSAVAVLTHASVMLVNLLLVFIVEA